MIFWGVFAWYLPIVNFAVTIVALLITGVLFAFSPYYIQSVIYVGELGDMLPMKGWFQFFFNIINEISTISFLGSLVVSVLNGEQPWCYLYTSPFHNPPPHSSDVAQWELTGIQLLTFLALLIIAIRFYDIYLIRRSTTFTKEIVNYCSLFFGILMTIGMFLFTNVQHVVSREVNWSGWLIYIIAALVYMVAETYLFWSLSESYRFVKILNILRILALGTYFASVITLFSSLLRWVYEVLPRVDHLLFFHAELIKNEPGYYNYCIYAMMEWILILIISLYLLTYVYEFRHLDIQQDL